MKPSVFVRPLTAAERARLRAGLRSTEAFTLRRCQILLASASGQAPPHIARALGCTAASVRNAIHAFQAEGLACLVKKSSRPKTTRPIPGAAFDEPLRALLHQSPRAWGQPRSTWTLGLLAQVCFQRGWAPRALSLEAIRRAVRRLGISWRRAKHGITSPDPAYARKEAARDRLIRLAAAHPGWVLGFEDETWWSRLARPELNVWAGGGPQRLEQLEIAKDDPDPKALCRYGLLRADTGGMLVRFVDGRPVSQVTESFLGWVCQQLAAEGKTALLLVWDNASWHVSQRVRAWIRAHNRRVKREGGVRIVVRYLPIKSPWLNPIEPKWVHGKRAIVAPDRLLTASEVQERVCCHYRCTPVERLKQTDPAPKKAAKRKKVA